MLRGGDSCCERRRNCFVITVSSLGAAARCAEDKRSLSPKFQSPGPTPTACWVWHPRASLWPPALPPEDFLLGKDAAWEGRWIWGSSYFALQAVVLGICPLSSIPSILWSNRSLCFVDCSSRQLQNKAAPEISAISHDSSSVWFFHHICNGQISSSHFFIIEHVSLRSQVFPTLFNLNNYSDLQLGWLSHRPFVVFHTHFLKSLLCVRWQEAA